MAVETIVWIIMLAVGFNFVLKLTWHRTAGVLALAAVAAIFTACMWEYAAGSSATLLADRLSQRRILLDVAVILTLDVACQILFCVLMARRLAGERLSRGVLASLGLLKWTPGLLLFPGLLLMLAELIFAMPGTDFMAIAFGAAAAVMAVTPATAFGLKYLLPDDETRLELMFLVSLLTAVTGVAIV